MVLDTPVVSAARAKQAAASLLCNTARDAQQRHFLIRWLWQLGPCIPALLSLDQLGGKSLDMDELTLAALAAAPAVNAAYSFGIITTC